MVDCFKALFGWWNRETRLSAIPVENVFAQLRAMLSAAVP